jgi:hypothetical protein
LDPDKGQYLKRILLLPGHPWVSTRHKETVLGVRTGIIAPQHVYASPLPALPNHIRGPRPYPKVEL